MTVQIRAGAADDAYIQINGVDKLKIDLAGNLTLLTAGAKVITESAFQTGDFMHKQRASVPAGWIPANGGTIGSAASGATYASVGTLALFTLWWAEYNDATLPILTSAGAASTRGATAAADWAANKRLSIFDLRDRVVRAPGTVQGNGAKLEPTVVFDNFGTLGTVGQPGTAVLPGSGVATRNGDGGDSLPSSPWQSVTTQTNAALALTGQRVRVASLGIPGFYKL